MDLTVLGMHGGFPGENGACSGYLLEEGNGGARILLDLGCGTLPRLNAITDICRIDALVLSHLHFDHASDALTMQYGVDARIRDGRMQCLPLYLPASPAPVRALFDAASAYAPHTVTDGMMLRIGGLTLRFTRVQHPVETYAVRVTAAGENGKTLLYTGDSGLCDALFPAAAGADALLIDTAFSNARREAAPAEALPHMTPMEAARLAAASGASVGYCTHMPPEKETAAKIRAEIDRTPLVVVQELGHYAI